MVDALKLEVLADYHTLSVKGAEFVASLLRAKPDAAVVVATGNTPLGLYRELAEMRARGEVDSSRLRTFQLDAYLGLAPDDPRSLYRWMKEAFLDPLEISEAQVVRLPGDAPDPHAACRAFDETVASAGGFDLAILGLGPNGHLGFNEPPSGPADATRVVTLTEASVTSNAAYWGRRDRVPEKALTAGMNLLLEAKNILLLVSGGHKHAILRRTVEGTVTPDVPASYLQRAVNVTVLADRAAWRGEDAEGG